MTSLEAELAASTAWGKETFPRSTLSARVAHLRREVEELETDPTNPEEMADCAILLAGAMQELLDRAELQGVDMAQAVRDKLAILRTREWGEPDAEGVVEHVRA